MQFLLAFGIGTNLFALWQLFSKNYHHHIPGRIGIAINLIWTLRFFFLYIKFESFVLNYPFLLVFDQFLFILDGVLLWLYSRSLLGANKFSRKVYWHFVPFLVGFSLACYNAFRFPDEVVINFQNALKRIEQNTQIVDREILIFVVVILLFSLIYFIKTQIEIKRYNYSLFQNFSNIEELQVTWVLTFQRLWISLFIIPVIIYFLNYLNPVLDSIMLLQALIASLVLLSFFFNASLLKFSLRDLGTLGVESEDNVKSLPNIRAVEELDRLYEIMENEKYYLEEDLTLQQLANYLDMKPVELTNLIKVSRFENFYDLVNAYRLEAVKQMLLNTSEQIIVIAYQNGFNSKSAFNKIFKEKTGQTPREFRKSHK
jgi:AraC-like DNA-binding protein